MRESVLDNATLWIGDGDSLDGHLAIEGDAIKAVEGGRYAGPLPAVHSGSEPGLR